MYMLFTWQKLHDNSMDPRPTQGTCRASRTYTGINWSAMPTTGRRALETRTQCLKHLQGKWDKNGKGWIQLWFKNMSNCQAGQEPYEDEQWIMPSENRGQRDEAILCEGRCQQRYHRGCMSVLRELFATLTSSNTPFHCLTCSYKSLDQ